MKKFLLLFALLSCINIQSQNEKDLALSKAKEAIQLMDEGHVEESIRMLQESQKLDPNNFIYPYEIAYAKVLQEKYSEAIDILEKVKKYESINSQIYQLLGNCYSYLGKPEKAIEKYEEGIDRFPDAGNLYLEKGNIYNHQENYPEAIENYKKGITADPMFPSNYYNLASLYLNSNDKLSGLIYGEIFMNIERTTGRTQKMSELLYQTYKTSIIFRENESEIDFCDIIVEASAASNGELKLPLCAIFGKNFILGIIGQKEVNLATLSEIRSAFLKNYFQEDFKNHPNVLFSYQKKLLDQDVFDAYNHYLFQMGEPEEFNRWQESSPTEYSKFVDWYTQNENIITLSQENIFLN